MRWISQASRWAVAVWVGLVAGCAAPVHPYQTPGVDLPPLPIGVVEPVLMPQWWRSFGDSALNAWVEDALKHNWDLAKAATQVAEARANLGSAQAVTQPRLDAIGSASVTQRRFSLSVSPEEFNRQTSTATVGLALSWELDLWGRIEQMNEAARATWKASELIREATALSVAGLVCDTYFQFRTLEEKLRIAQQTQQQLQSLSNLEFRRWQVGLGTKTAYNKSLMELASAQSQIPALEAGLKQAAAGLQVLAGRSPAQVGQVENVNAHTLHVPVVPYAIDSRLLLRRPDVAASEMTLQAAHANWNSTLAQRYPQVNLSLLGGWLASSSALVKGVPHWQESNLGISGPLGDAGLTESQGKASEARRDRALVMYQQTVLQAMRDVHDALQQNSSSDQQLVAVNQELNLRDESLGFAQRSYQAGRISRYEVISEAVKVLQAQWALSDAQQAQWVARSHFYKAIGGGL